MTYLVVGASAGLGREVARRLAARKSDLVIVSSDRRDLEVMASDLAIRHRVKVETVEADLGAADPCLQRLVEAIQRLGRLDGLIFTAGANLPDDDLTLEFEQAQRLLRINFQSIVYITAELLPLLRNSPGASITAFGSVAALRGRRRNIYYSCAKRALQSFFESLRHSLVGAGIATQFYVVGYLATNLAFGIPTPLPKADPEAFSAKILANLNKDMGVVYYPWYWKYLGTIVRMTPWSVFRRLDF
ncbi:MAG: SDR family NAD(P)-dependent oxidoreductase [Deltaproteobacteria bacterium]|nr:SDR family NAD(P)-dependent oxidoreductase [Deltaproteobacteria bacterium]